MKVGVQLPEVEREVRWPELAQMCRLIEDAGFDSIWVGDHLLYRTDARGPHGPWEAWSQMAAAAAITERVEIGPLVAATSFHTPAMLAKKASTLDEISQGRFILGLGAGWNKTEYEAFGFPYDRRASRFEAAFDIIRRLLDGEEVTHHSEFYDVERCVLLPQGPTARLPLLIGSVGPRVLGITAPYMTMWNAWYSWYANRPDGLPPLLENVFEVLAGAGRDPAEVEMTTAILMQFPGGEGRMQAEPQFEARPLTGSPAELADWLHQWEGAGISHVQLVLDPITLDSVAQAARVLEAFRAR